MRKNGLRILAAIAVAIVLFAGASCKKSNNAPSLSIDAPLSGDDVATGDSILIEATATDDKGLHELAVWVLNTIGDTVFKEAPYVHNLKSYKVKYHFPPVDTGNYFLYFSVLDHDLNLVERKIDFHASFPPTLVLSSPADSLELSTSDSLYIAGTASHDIGLHELQLVVVNYKNLDTALFQTYSLTGQTNYSFSNFFHPVDTGSFYMGADVTNYKDEHVAAFRRFHVH